MKALEDRMKKIQELTLTMSSEAKVQHHQQTLEKFVSLVLTQHVLAETSPFQNVLGRGEGF